MRLVIALAVVALAIVAFPSGFAVAHLSGPSLQAPAGLHTDVTQVAIDPTDQYGYTQSSYSVGLSNGEVYFAATDTSADTTATVAINDQNASRDGLTNPVVSWTVKIVGSQNLSYTYGAHYQLPLNLVYGGWWNITISGTSGGFASTGFMVDTYQVESTITPYESLPAHVVQVVILAISTVNSGIYNSLTSVWLGGTYNTTSFTSVGIPGLPAKLGTAGYQTYNITVPSNALGQLSIVVYANTTTSSGTFSSLSASTTDIGTLGAPTVILSASPTGSATSSFVAGTPVYVRVYAWISAGYSGPAIGVNVNLRYESNAVTVTPPGGAPTTVVTNSGGWAYVTFLASRSNFTTTGINSVVATVSDPADPSDTSTSTTADFSIHNQTPMPSVQVSLDALQYYQGATVHATWQLGGANASVLSGWYGDLWYVALSNNQILDLTSLDAGGATPTSGSVSFNLPASYTGTLSVIVLAHNATSVIENEAQAKVLAATITLTANEARYSPGDTVTVSANVQGTLASGSTLWGTVVDPNGNFVFNAALSGNQVQWTVPAAAAPTYYDVTVVAQTSSGGTVANATLEVSEANGIDLLLSIVTSSNYQDGSYQPGQTVTIHYQLVARGGETLPTQFMLYVYPYSSAYSGHDSKFFSLTGSSGDVQFTVPSDAPNGMMLIEGEAAWTAVSCSPSCYTYSDFGLSVNNNPGVLAYQLGTSGVSIGGLLLVVALIVLGLIGVLWLRRRSHGPKGGMHPYQGGGSSSSMGGSGASGTTSAPPSSGSSGPSNPPGK